jgi:hypothetical protein
MKRYIVQELGRDKNAYKLQYFDVEGGDNLGDLFKNLNILSCIRDLCD